MVKVILTAAGCIVILLSVLPLWCCCIAAKQADERFELALYERTKEVEGE